MRTLILAAGKQTRWRQSGGKGLKQFVTVDGEPLIRRTFRLASERCPEVLTIVKDPEHERWEGLNPHAAEYEDWMGEMGKFLQHRHLWGSHSIVVLYGDAYYTEATLDRIYEHRPDQPTVYGRANAKGRRLEAFGLRWSPKDRDEVVRVAEETAQAGLNGRGGAFRWFLRRHTGADTYKSARVKKLAKERNGWVELAHDATEDFDKLTDLRRWRRKYRKAK